MSNAYFQFKQFTVHQQHCAMKVTTDACLFGAWVSQKTESEKPKNQNVLDVGTGTGLLSLMLAQQNPHLQTEAIEIDASAAEQAKENIKKSPWPERISIVHADIKNIALAKQYGIIISNPPFYETDLQSGDNKKNIAHHAGGLLLQELLPIIRQQLATEGRFYLLLPYKRWNEAITRVHQSGLSITEAVLVRQSVQHDFFRVMIEGAVAADGKDKEYQKSEIAIWDSGRRYTKEFTDLLKSYYLYL